MNQAMISQELLGTLFAKSTERGEPCPFDHLFEIDFLPLWQQTTMNNVSAELRPRERLHRRQRKRNRKLRKAGWVTADIGGIDPCLHIIVKRGDIAQWVTNSNVRLRVNVPNGEGVTKSYLVSVSDAYDTNGRLIHICFVVSDSTDGSESASLSEQEPFVPEDELHRLKEALRTTLIQDNRFANFGDLWFIASMCPALTKTHITAIMDPLTAHPDGVTGNSLLNLIPDYAPDASDAVRRFALNWRMLTDTARRFYCLSEERVGEWSLRAMLDSQRQEFTPRQFRTPRGSVILDEEELREASSDDIPDPTLRQEIQCERAQSPTAQQYQRREALEITPSASEWISGCLCFSESRVAFFRDVRGKTTLHDATTGRKFVAILDSKTDAPQFHRHLLFGDALAEWLWHHVVPGAYVTFYRTQSSRVFEIGWKRNLQGQVLRYNPPVYNRDTRRVERLLKEETYDCLVDESYFIEQARFNDLVAMQVEAEQAGVFWQIMVQVFRKFDPHGQGLTWQEIFKFTDALRAASPDSIRSILYSRDYPCFQRGDDGKYRLNEELGRVGSPRPKPKAKITLSHIENVVPPIQPRSDAGVSGSPQSITSPTTSPPPPLPDHRKLVQGRLSKVVKSLDMVDARLRGVISDIQQLKEEGYG